MAELCQVCRTPMEKRGKRYELQVWECPSCHTIDERGD